MSQLPVTILNPPQAVPDRSPVLSTAEERALLRAAALAKTNAWRPRFFRNVRADVRQHGAFFTRSVLGLMVFRFGAWALTKPRWLRAVLMKLYGVVERISRVVTGLNMHCSVLVGDNLHLIHAEGPISIHPDVVLGDRVGIMHGVTLGLAIDAEGAPIIGDDVFIGTGAVVLGPIVVGNNSRIAANSLVITNVPPNCIAIGVPARVLRRTDIPQTPVKTAARPVLSTSPNDVPRPKPFAGSES